MSLELHPLVALARSAISTSSTLRPRPAASRAMPAPLMPPPMTSRSYSADLADWADIFLLPFPRDPPGYPLLYLRAPEPGPPEEPDHRLCVLDQTFAHPLQRVLDRGGEHLEVLPGVQPGAHVPEAARAVELDHLV